MINPAEERKKSTLEALQRYYNTHDCVKERLELAQDEARRARKAKRQAKGDLTEHEHQSMLVKWLEEQGHRPFSVPNGTVFGGSDEKRFRYNAYLRAEGRRSGVPDLFCVLRTGGKCKLVAIEMKKPGGKVSPEQQEWANVLSMAGIVTVFGFGFDDARTQIQEIEGGMR